MVGRAFHIHGLTWLEIRQGGDVALNHLTIGRDKRKIVQAMHVARDLITDRLGQGLRRARGALQVSVQHTHVEEAATFGIIRTTPPGGTRSQWVTTCECGQVHSRGWKTNMPPEAMTKFLTNAGWKVSTRHKPICPECNKEALMTRRNPAEGAPLDPKTMRILLNSLDACFNEETLRYCDGNSDATVARDTDLPIETVIQVRREAYGELAEDEELTQLRKDARQFLDNLGELETNMLANLSETMDPLRASLKQMVARLDAAEARLLQRN